MGNLNLFFTYEDALPEGTGYETLGGRHITILLICLAAILLIAVIHKIKRGNTLILSLTPLFLILLRFIYVLIIKARIVYELPLHFCSIAGLLCPIYELLCSAKNENRILKYLKDSSGALLSCIGIPATLIAMVFPNAGYYPPVHFITIVSFAFHTVICAYIIIKIMDEELIPNAASLVKSYPLLLVLAAAVFIFDKIYETNYMFLLSPSYGSPLSQAYFKFGYFGYLFIYAGLVFSVSLLLSVLLPMAINKNKNGVLKT